MMDPAISSTHPEQERAAAFLLGQSLDVDALSLGTTDEWVASAWEYLSRAVSGASGAATVRVSVAALMVLLAHTEPQEAANG